MDRNVEKRNIVEGIKAELKEHGFKKNSYRWLRISSDVAHVVTLQFASFCDDDCLAYRLNFGVVATDIYNELWNKSPISGPSYDDADCVFRDALPADGRFYFAESPCEIGHSIELLQKGLTDRVFPMLDNVTCAEELLRAPPVELPDCTLGNAGILAYALLQKRFRYLEDLPTTLSLITGKSWHEKAAELGFDPAQLGGPV